MKNLYDKIEIPIDFTQITLVNNRHFFGEAAISKDREKITISGFALRGNSILFKIIYRLIGFITFVGLTLLSFWFFIFINLVEPIATRDSNPGHFMIDLLFLSLSGVIGYKVSKAILKYIFRTKNIEELSIDNIKEITRGEEIEETQFDNTTNYKQVIIIMMKDSNNGIEFTCARRDATRILCLID